MAENTLLLLLTLSVSFSIFRLSDGAAVHAVGGSSGWTINPSVDYKTWALTKTFQVGDIIVFNYDPKFHNVIRVTHAEYKACNVSSPISTHNTGNDSITIDGGGHHFFVCGAPGHCEAGQKVDINVPREHLVAPNPSGSPSSPVAKVGAPAPSPSGGARRVGSEKLGLIMVLLILFGFS